MDIPVSVKRATVEGSLLKVALDSRDAGDDMEAGALPNLRAVVDATVPYIVSEGTLYVLEPFVFHTNQAGEIVNGGHPDDGLVIPATTGNGPEFLYQVSITWDGQSEKHRRALTWRASAPEDGVLDLGTVVDAPTPEEIPGWLDAMVQVAADRALILAARDEAVAARDEAEEFRDQAGAIAAGGILDDDAPSAGTTYSSVKIESLVAGRAPSSHTHSAAQITSGTLNAARLPAASTSARGGVELATETETTTGTDSTRAVTPAGLAAAFSAFTDSTTAKGAGLVGDGSDEGATLKAFLAQGGVLHLEPGKTYGFRITDELAIPAGTALHTNGAKLKMIGSAQHPTAPAPSMVRVNANVKVIGRFRVECDGGEEYSADIRVAGDDVEIDFLDVSAISPISAIGQMNCGVYVGNVKRLKIGMLSVSNYWRGFQTAGGDVMDIGFAEISGHAQGILVNNTVRFTLGGGRMGDISPYATGGAAENSVILTNVVQARIRNVDSDESSEHGFRLGGMTVSRDVLFENCTARNSGSGATTPSGACGFKALGYTGSADTEKHTNVRYVDCTVYDSKLVGNNDEGFHIGKCRDVVLDNCRVLRDNKTRCATTGVYLYGVQNVHMSNVMVDTPQMYGVLVRSLTGSGLNYGGGVASLVSTGLHVRAAQSAAIRVQNESGTVRASNLRFQSCLMESNALVVQNVNGAHTAYASFEGMITGSSGEYMTNLSDKWVLDMVQSSLYTPANARTGSTARSMAAAGGAKRMASSGWVDY